MRDACHEELEAQLLEFILIFCNEGERKGTRVDVPRGTFSGGVNQLGCLYTMGKISAGDAVVRCNFYPFFFSCNDRNGWSRACSYLDF